MDSRVVRVGCLDEFTAEVRTSHPIPGSPIEPCKTVIRLSLTERWRNGHGLPGKVVELHLQGANDLNEIVWLMESHEVIWLTEGPASPRDKSIYEQMLIMRRLV